MYKRKSATNRVRMALFLFCLILTACGKSANVVDENSEAMTYFMQFRDVPDPEESLARSPLVAGKANWYALEKGIIYREGGIDRLLLLMELGEDGTEQYLGEVLQTFHEDSWEWKVTDVSGIKWLEDDYATAHALVGATEEGVFLWVTMYGEGEEVSYVVFFDGTKTKQVCRLPEGMIQPVMYQDGNGNLYLMENYPAGPTERTITLFDGEYHQKKQIDFDADYLMDMEWNPAQEKMSCLGTQNGTVLYWKDATEASRKKETALRSDGAFRLACDKEGRMYLGSAAGIWEWTEQPEQRLSFPDRGYSLEQLYSMDILESGEIVCYVALDGVLCRMELQQVPVQEQAAQQELTLGVSFQDEMLQQIVTKFNRMYPQYHVSMESTDNPTLLQAELAAGKGPDMLLLSDERFYRLASAGYLKPLDGVVEDPSLFVEAAMEAGKKGNTMYGIPFCFCMTFPKFSKEIAGDRKSWTVEEMMQCIEQAETVVSLSRGTDGKDLVYAYGLLDTENKSYIDWEKGISHLTEQPFAELVRFAEKYQDRMEQNSDTLSWFREGKYAADGYQWSMQNLGMMDRFEELLEGGASYVGFPSRDGKGGILMRPQIVCVNRASDQDGALQFLRFVQEEEAQRKCEVNGGYAFPVRRSTISYLIGQEQKKKDKPVGAGDDVFFWEENGLDEEQLQQFYDMLERARPFPAELEELQEIVNEELEQYFSGNRPLEETLRILDSRVQLYLDERK